MEIVKFVYQGKQVDFEIDKEDVMVNANKMGEIFGKIPYDFYHTENVKNFLKAFHQNDNCRSGDDISGNDNCSFQNEFTPNGKLIKVLKGDPSVNGTWMHRVVALKFAAWLDPNFEVWVFKTIDILLNSYFKEQREALIERLSAKQKKEQKKQEILLKYADITEITEYFELEQNEKNANKKRLSSLRQQIIQLKLELF